MIHKVFLTSVRIYFNFDGVTKTFGKYPFAKILIADVYMCSWDINSPYSAMTCLVWFSDTKENLWSSAVNLKNEHNAISLLGSCVVLQYFM